MFEVVYLYVVCVCWQCQIVVYSISLVVLHIVALGRCCSWLGIIRSVNRMCCIYRINCVSRAIRGRRARSRRSIRSISIIGNIHISRSTLTTRRILYVVHDSMFRCTRGIMCVCHN